MANEYATPAELRATLELTGETFADADLTLALAAASRGIDQATGRRFFPDPDANQVRHYSPPAADVLLIDDLVTLTSLNVDTDGDGTFEETWVLNTDFVLEPLNAAADSHPWTRLRTHPLRGKQLPWRYPRSVELTGKFGWDEAPDEIKQATVIIASKLVQRAREAPFGILVGADSLAVYIARQDPEVMFLIEPYSRLTFVG